MALQQVVHLALTHSRVLRDLGGTVLRTPESVRTPYGPAIRESDPRYGVEAALSAFDTQFSTELFFEKNDRRLNNESLGQTGFFQQDLDVFQAELSKRAATGSQFSLRKNIDFDNDSSVANTFPNGAWNVSLEGEVRHPLLQGGGLLFNRIAGPGSQPGAANGVLIARISTDVSLAEFEMGLRNFVSNVENAYWDLYFAYRNLDTKVRARDASLETWRTVKAWEGREGGEAEKEAQAREQYFRFEQEVQDALAGRLLEGTRTNNGSTPGTFRGLPGVHVHERKLRLLIGLPINDLALIRPVDEPPRAPVTFDWHAVNVEALIRRAELRRQRWQVKRHELELIAAKNHLLPSLDLVGRYRWRGFGEELIDGERDGKARFDNAFMDLTSGDFQEWMLGAEFSMPIGFRQAHTSVRNAQLRVAQATIVLREQERQVIHDLSNAVAEMDRAYAGMITSFNRNAAAQDQLKRLWEKFRRPHDETTRPQFFVVLDAQRRAADAEIRYFQAQVEYALAMRNVHFEKGTLLDYCGVVMAEGPWPNKAYIDAAKLDRLRGPARPLNYSMQRAPVVSRGTYPQQTMDPNRTMHLQPAIPSPPPLDTMPPLEAMPPAAAVPPPQPAPSNLPN
ncbi:MAG: TolC family protein [Candidatus Nealsonbacteria bacterium]|nr:TolC family protein [Candidatus Nealsonbacteria bacterium]